jgi:pyruvate dehydrogenase E1 component alpha subunit
LKANDPIARFRKTMIETGIATSAEADAVLSRARAAVDEAFAFARAAAYPAPEEALAHVFA